MSRETLDIVNDMRRLVTRVTSADATLREKHDAFDGLVAAFQDMAYVCAHAVSGDFHLPEDVSQQADFGFWILD